MEVSWDFWWEAEEIGELEHLEVRKMMLLMVDVRVVSTMHLQLMEKIVQKP